MKIFKIVSYSLIQGLLIGCLLCLPSYKGYAQEDAKNIIILNSYHKGYQWTDGQSDSILRSFKENNINCTTYVEYMDWKRFPSKENLNNLYNQYKTKYSKKKIDLIMTTDDMALIFALQHRDVIFSNAPIIFGGVIKETADQLLLNEENVTGVYEATDPEGTMEVAKKLFPNIEEVYLIHDNTESGKAFGEIDKNAIMSYDKNIRIHELNDLSIGDVCKKVSTLGSNSIIMIDAYSSDGEGVSMPTEKFADLITKSSTVPVFINGEALMGHGCIGGSILGNNLHGLKMAELAINFLGSNKINSIPIVDKKTVYLGFDYQVLERFKVPVKNLPPKSIIINKPFSFYETYRIQVNIVLAIFIFMSLLIIFLLYMIKLRRIAEAQLKESNSELSNLYEEIAISEETLKENYIELETKQKELSLSEEKYRLVAEASMDVFWEIDFLTGSVVFSDRIKDLLGYSKGEIGTYAAWCEMVYPEDADQVIKNMNDHISNASIYFKPTEYRVCAKEGMNKWVLSNAKGTMDEYGKLRMVFGAWTDITGIKEQQFKINKLAYFDSTTGLSNRVLLGENMEELIRNREEFAIFYIDVDNFKVINDSYGHLMGDKLLLSMAKRMVNIDKSTAYRLGGDEFILLLKKADNIGHTEEVARYILEELSQPYLIDNNLFYISTSIGIVMYPDNGNNYEELLKNADMALYWSKGTGKGRYSFFNKNMSDDSLYKIRIQNDLHRALADHEFTLYYQPMIDIKSGSIKGLEALIRWEHPADGLIMPDKFIGIAEESGNIIKIGNWVMNTACSFAKELYDTGYRDFHISVNVSSIQLVQEDFLDTMLRILNDTGLPFEYLMIEITESVLMKSFEHVIQTLEKIKAMGVIIALDDFGYGYSSLTYLQQLPIQTLKIDKSFVSDILTVTDEQCIISSIIGLAKKLGIKTVAEGVEEESQLNYLEKYECDLFQGYLASRPVTKAEILRLFAVGI